MLEKEYINKLSSAALAYYNGGKESLSDTAFDSLQEEFTRNYPDSSYLQVVGAPATGKKIKHKNKMISMNKAKTLEDMASWIKKISADKPVTEYTITFKLDGLSGKAIYVNGIISSLCTRGDGSIGQDISHLIPYLAIPKSLEGIPGYYEVDGELILPKDNGVYTTKLRNAAAGIVNRKSDLSEAHLLHFVAFHIPTNPESTVALTYGRLSMQGFITGPTYTESTVMGIMDIFDRYQETFREAFNYETDGLVIWVDDTELHAAIDSLWIVEKYHHYNIALKPTSEEQETTLERIEWNLSAQGKMIPKAFFELIQFNGANHTRATLNNFENVIKLNLIPGDKILVSKRNDIIPCVEENLDIDTTRRVEIPRICPSCGKPLDVDGVHIVCTYEHCEGKSLKKIVKFVESLNPDGLGEGTVTNLVENEVIANIPDLLLLKEGTLLGLEGFQSSKITKVLEAIEEMKQVTFVELLDALSIPLVGKKALAKLEVSSMETFTSFLANGSVIGDNLLSWRMNTNNLELLEQLLGIMSVTEKASSDIKGIIVLTGKAHKPRKGLEQDLEEMGYTMGKSVTKETLYVVTDDVDGTSSKLVKARKNGVAVTTYEEFFA